jgi:hypothetical protein
VVVVDVSVKWRAGGVCARARVLLCSAVVVVCILAMRVWVCVRERGVVW